MFSSKTFGFTKQPQLARCWLGDLIKPIYIRGWWRTQVRGPSVWMLCSVRSLCRPLSWLSTNQRRPPPLNQSQRPFPLSWRDVECADVEPCNSILLSKSSRSFLWNWKYTRTFYFLHTFLLNKKSSNIQLLDFGGLGCPFPGCQGVVLDQQHWWWSCVRRCSTAAPSLLWSCPPPSTCQELPAAAVVKQILHQQTWDYANKTTSSQQWEFEDFRVSYNIVKGLLSSCRSAKNSCSPTQHMWSGALAEQKRPQSDEHCWPDRPRALWARGEGLEQQRAGGGRGDVPQRGVGQLVHLPPCCREHSRRLSSAVRDCRGDHRRVGEDDAGESLLNLSKCGDRPSSLSCHL